MSRKAKKLFLLVVVEGNDAPISQKIKTWTEFQQDRVELVTVPSLARAQDLNDSQVWLNADALLVDAGLLRGDNLTELTDLAQGYCVIVVSGQVLRVGWEERTGAQAFGTFTDLTFRFVTKIVGKCSRQVNAKIKREEKK